MQLLQMGGLKERLLNAFEGHKRAPARHFGAWILWNLRSVSYFEPALEVPDAGPGGTG